MRGLICLALAVSLALSQQLMELKDSTFTQLTSIPLQFSKPFTLTENWFILFYVPWCHHCKHVYPDWVTLATLAHNDTRIAVVNCDANSQICSSLSVQQYPTLLYFNKEGKALEYSSLRSLSEFKKFVDGGFIDHPERSLKRTSVCEVLYLWINSFDWFSLLIFSTVVATFWYIVFRFLFTPSRRDQNSPPCCPKSPPKNE